MFSELFNFYGHEVNLQDLITQPLNVNETLMQDPKGRYRRIRAPTIESNIFQKVIFWIQTHLNEKDHLVAIDKLITLFHQQLLENPPTLTEKVQEYHFQADCLVSLQNDYAFIFLKKGDSSFITTRLQEIKELAYALFAQHLLQLMIVQETKRREEFLIFQTFFEKQIHYLAASHEESLQETPLLILAPFEFLRWLVSSQIESILERIEIIREIRKQMNDIEKEHQGKFTIPHLEEYIGNFRRKLSQEGEKIKNEIEMIVGNLLVNYSISPHKAQLRTYLETIQICEEQKGLDWETYLMNQIDREISRLQKRLLH